MLVVAMEYTFIVSPMTGLELTQGPEGLHLGKM